MKIRDLVSIILFVIVIGTVVFGLSYYRSQKPLETGLPVQVKVTPRFIFNIYEGKNKLVRPLGISKDRNNLVYVSNNDGQSVEVFTANGRSKRSLGGRGQQPGEFLYPYGIGILPNGNLIVSETGNSRVQELTPQGKYVKTFVGTENSLDLGKPGPIYVDSKGHVYIGDLSGSQVLVLNQDAELLHKIKNISYPHGIAVDEENRKLYISDAKEVRIKVFSLDKLENGPVAVIENYLPGQRFSMLRGLAVDNLGRLYVVDTIVNAIRVFDKNGSYLFSFGRQGFGDGEFLFPNQIFADNSGKIFISDWGNNRVQVWGY